MYLQQDPAMASMMSAFNDPTNRVAMEEKLKALQSDPELAPIMKEIEETGPAALMKCVPPFIHCVRVHWVDKVALLCPQKRSIIHPVNSHRMCPQKQVRVNP